MTLAAKSCTSLNAFEHSWDHCYGDAITWATRHRDWYDYSVHRDRDSGYGRRGGSCGGISQALITTAAGLTVAIPSLVMHRYLHGRVDAIVVRMERDANQLVEALEMKGTSTFPAEVGQ